MRAAPSRSGRPSKSTQSPRRPSSHLEPCGESDAAFVAAVDLVEPLGADTLAHGTVEGTRIVVRLTGAQRVSEGRLPLRFDPAQRHYFEAGSGARIEAV